MLMDVSVGGLDVLSVPSWCSSVVFQYFVMEHIKVLMLRAAELNLMEKYCR